MHKLDIKLYPARLYLNRGSLGMFSASTILIFNINHTYILHSSKLSVLNDLSNVLLMLCRRVHNYPYNNASMFEYMYIRVYSASCTVYCTL